MLENIIEACELGSLARRRKSPLEFCTVRESKLEDELAQGWKVVRHNSGGTVRLSREKTKPILLEDRAWSLLYALGFSHLSGHGGAWVRHKAQDGDPTSNQVDVVGLDEDVAVALECKTAAGPKKAVDFDMEVARLALMRDRFSMSVHSQFPQDHNRACVLALLTWDLMISDADSERARKENVVLLNEHDLAYYEELAGHLGEAAKYQFFADLIPGRRVHGLKLELPALRTKVGKYTCYSFAVRPEYLLKISYVSHRKKGKATDIGTYQRMISKSRLKKIREYISNDGIFPTNIVINLEGKKCTRFDEKKDIACPEGAEYGQLTLTPAYKSAWVIDGQHRLFGYSGHPRAKTSYLQVLAFEDVQSSIQAQLFIDINHEQKSVKKSLLHELFGELNWDAEDEDKRIGAIIAKTIQALNDDMDSPLKGCIRLTDDKKTPRKCISSDSFFTSMDKTPGMYQVRKGLEYGPFWAGESLRTLKRGILVLKEWFRLAADGAPDWWEIGSGEGGGLAMNDGIAIMLEILRDVFAHLSNVEHVRLVQLTDSELIEKIRPFGAAMGAHFHALGPDQRADFRAGARGIQGQTAQRRKIEKVISAALPAFSPPGLKEYVEAEEQKTNEKAYPVIQRIERTLKSVIIDTLKAEFTDGAESWWYQGVPEKNRTEIAKRVEQDQGKLGGREDYFDLVDFRETALANWLLFDSQLTRTAKGNKAVRTEWLVRLNNLRKIVMHPSKGRVLTVDELAELHSLDEWLQTQLRSADNEPQQTEPD
jgi:DNA sulfur modification protein DndB